MPLAFGSATGLQDREWQAGQGWTLFRLPDAGNKPERKTTTGDGDKMRKYLVGGFVAVALAAGLWAWSRPIAAAPKMTACSVTFTCARCYSITSATWTGNPTQAVPFKCVACGAEYTVRID